MIEVRSLTKRYREHTAINDISFCVEKGSILGFLGPNGAGKTTTMKILTCAMPASSGSASIDGFDVFEEPIEIKRRVGYLPENPPLYTDMTVKSYLDFAASIKGVSKKTKKSRLDEVMEKCGIMEVKDRLIQNISKGYKQRVGLAQAIVHDPAVLILDEPTVGLDPKQIIEIRSLIKSLGGNHTVILCSHILPEITMTCDQVVIINEGKIVAMDSLEGLSASLRKSNKIFVKVKRSNSDFNDRILKIKGVLKVTNDEIDKDKFLVESGLDKDIREEVAKEVVNGGFGLLELGTISMSLEDVFLRLTTEEI
ncbi:MAG: ATP-binding cassette domain-containing protein [bacterium]